jgi:pantoate--beta-alanine ligase
MPVQIIAAPTVREADGFAKSSRNQYLNTAERALAPAIYATLAAAAQRIRAADADYASIERAGFRALEAAGFRVDYFSVRQAVDLSSPAASGDLVVLTAVRLGGARLIDNIRIERA